MKIPCSEFPHRGEDVELALARASRFLAEERRPYAFIINKAAPAAESSPCDSPPPRHDRATAPPITAQASHHRMDFLRQLRSLAGPRAIIVSSTGYASRELYACGDSANQFYMVGSMGCASSIGLGLAAVRPDRRVIVVDGDGAAVMRLGAMSAIGHERPRNLLHLLIDNGVYESTGGQATVSPSLNFCGLALANGYENAASVSTPEEFAAAYDASEQRLSFIHLPVLPGIADALPRPAIAPKDVAERFRGFVKDQD